VTGSSTTAVGTSFLRNVASQGGAVFVEDTSSFAAGADADDNADDDVYAAGQAWIGYAAASTFTCDGTGCDPTP
jgi:predicted outer membrane repeat protein